MESISIIFSGFTYPNGMAGTKRNEHAIRALSEYNAKISVLVTRQSTNLNQPNGNNHGIEYDTIMPDTLRGRFVINYPYYFFKAQKKLKEIIKKNGKQTVILFFYGRPNISNLPLIIFGKSAGHLIVFDLVEDDSLAFQNTKSYWSRLNNILTRSLTRIILKQADGIIVISYHIKNKVRKLIGNKKPILFRPISVDFSKFNYRNKSEQNNIDLFYSGSFGRKDGLSVLIECFEKLAKNDMRIRLIMTGSSKSAAEVIKMIEVSQFKNRIRFFGYLSDQEYYNTMIKADILCVPRINEPYAHAGFPFKLGEFLATGKPVIVSKTGDVPLYLKNKESALLVEPGSSASLYNAVEFLISNPKKAQSIGTEGRNIALKYFDHLSQGKNLYIFLNQICKNGENSSN